MFCKVGEAITYYNYILMLLFWTEVVEHACSITTLLQGESMAGIAKDMDTHSYRTPLGVCGGVSA